MAEHDLTALMAAQLDRHLVFPLLEFLQERQLYADEEIPADMAARRTEVVARLRSLEEAAAPLVAFLSNPQLVQELSPDKQYNIHMLQERFQLHFHWIL